MLFLPGIILTIGILFLLNELTVWSWDIGRLWPIILIVLGLAFLSGRRSRFMGMWRRHREA